MIPGKYNLPPIRRGDTYPARAIATITDQATGDPIELTDARLQIRHKDTGVIIHEWSVTLTTITLNGATVNNVVNLDALANTTTQGFSTGNGHKYDLEVTTASGKVWTVLEGTVNIVEDVSF